MSSTARWMIAVVGLVCAVSFAAVAVIVPSGAREMAGLWTMAVFCLLITIACFPGPSRAIAVRLIGVAVFALYAFYIFSEVGKPLPHANIYRQSSPNIINAILGFFVFGLPAGWVALTGRFPRWTILGDKLHHDSNGDDSLEME